MTGFVKRLFGSKRADSDATAQRVKPQSTSGAYFLDEDSAKSLGNLDYMRTAQTIRRTFPKTAGSPEEKEVIKRVSAMDSVQLSKYEAEAAAQRGTPANQPNVQTSPTTSGEAAERRRLDSSMDLFRNMAKDIRKS